jgi:Spy/CpxP family protein refolding chaperone
MRIAFTALGLAVSLMLAGNLLAQDAPKDSTPKDTEKHQGQRGGRMFAGPFELLKGIDLTTEQKDKIKDLKKEYGPKLKELAEKAEGVLTADQKKARDDAHKAAVDAGKKGRELMQATRDAVKLTDDQKAKQKEIRTAGQDLTKEIVEKIKSILTDDQKEQLKKKMEGRRGRRQGGGDNPKPE